MTGALVAGWLLPLIAGCVVVATLDRRRDGWIATTFGYGLLFGMLLAGAAAAMAARDDTQHAWRHGVPWLIAVTVVSGVIVWWLRRRGVVAARVAPETNVALWKKILVCAALASLALRAWVMVREILLRPTYPWDAWDAWAVKSKAWFLLGHYVPFVDVAQWIQSAPREVFTGIAWDYPPTLAWIQVWFASAAGDWIEPFVNLPWFVLWVGMLVGHYGQWRALGIGRWRAAAFVYALGSLPLIDTHVALAGYADLWVAVLFGFAVLAWLRWLEFRERGQLVLAIVCVLILPLLKHEGLVWGLCLGAAMIFAATPAVWRWRALGVLLAVLLIVGVAGGLPLLLTVFGWVRSGSHAIELPVVGSLAFAWHGDAAVGVLYGLFVQPNWHLLWWLFPLIVIWRWRAFRGCEALRMCGLLIAGCLGLLMVLFVFTDASRWAESYTAVNRLIMHLVPALVTFLALLTRDAAFFPAPSDTVRSSDPLPDRA